MKLLRTKHIILNDRFDTILIAFLINRYRIENFFEKTKGDFLELIKEYPEHEENIVTTAIRSFENINFYSSSLALRHLKTIFQPSSIFDKKDIEESRRIIHLNAYKALKWLTQRFNYTDNNKTDIFSQIHSELVSLELYIQFKNFKKTNRGHDHKVYTVLDRRNANSDLQLSNYQRNVFDPLRKEYLKTLSAIPEDILKDQYNKLLLLEKKYNDLIKFLNSQSPFEIYNKKKEDCPNFETKKFLTDLKRVFYLPYIDFDTLNHVYFFDNDSTITQYVLHQYLFGSRAIEPIKNEIEVFLPMNKSNGDLHHRQVAMIERFKIDAGEMPDYDWSKTWKELTEGNKNYEKGIRSMLKIKNSKSYREPTNEEIISILPHLQNFPKAFQKAKEHLNKPS